jgi:hypothetical protein
MGTLEWTWLSPPPSPVQFTYSLSVPGGDTGDKQIRAVAKVRYGAGPMQAAATPDPVVVRQI